jgi:hypothetical protein
MRESLFQGQMTVDVVTPVPGLSALSLQPQSIFQNSDNPLTAYCVRGIDFTGPETGKPRQILFAAVDRPYSVR